MDLARVPRHIELVGRESNQPTTAVGDDGHPLAGSLGEDGRPVPHIEDEDSSRLQVTPNVGQRLCRVVICGLVPQHREHEKTRIETAVQSNRAEMANRELQFGSSDLWRVAASSLKHVGRSIDTVHAISLPGERDRVTADATVQVEDRAHVALRQPKRRLQTVALPLVVLRGVEGVVDFCVAVAEGNWGQGAVRGGRSSPWLRRGGAEFVRESTIGLCLEQSLSRGGIRPQVAGSSPRWVYSAA